MFGCFKRGKSVDPKVYYYYCDLNNKLVSILETIDGEEVRKRYNDYLVSISSNRQYAGTEPCVFYKRILQENKGKKTYTNSPAVINDGCRETNPEITEDVFLKMSYPFFLLLVLAENKKFTDHFPEGLGDLYELADYLNKNKNKNDNRDYMDLDLGNDIKYTLSEFKMRSQEPYGSADFYFKLKDIIYDGSRFKFKIPSYQYNNHINFNVYTLLPIQE